jgi:hypothetical protein
MLLVGTLALIACSGASAQEPTDPPIVPPENSAVNQYTESFPTSRGNKPLHGGQDSGERSASEAIGRRNARRLTREGGASGRALAEVAAETSPPALLPPTGDGSRGSAEKAAAGSASDGRFTGSPAPAREAAGRPEGASPLTETLGQATGLSPSGRIGLLLPAILVATILWALAYGARRARNTAP